MNPLGRWTLGLIFTHVSVWSLTGEARKCLISSPSDGRSVCDLFLLFIPETVFFYIAFSVKKLISHSCKQNFQKYIFTRIFEKKQFHSFTHCFKMQFLIHSFFLLPKKGEYF